MGLELYQTKISSPSRAVLMTIEYLQLNIELVEVDFVKYDNLSPEYLQMNPQHTVPTLKDGNFVVWDSHAIIIYLIEKLAPDNELYPNDIHKRATIHNRLFFDTGVLFPLMKSIYWPILALEVRTVPEDRLNALKEAYDFMEKFLGKQPFLAGYCFTIADICCLTSISCGNLILQIDPEEYPRLYKWFTVCQDMDCYQKGNGPGIKALADILASKLNSAEN